MVNTTEVRGRVAEHVGTKGRALKWIDVASALWLEIVVSVCFFAAAAWRIAVPLDENGVDTPATRASAYFQAANFIVFGLLGLGCVFWPIIHSSKREPKRANPSSSVRFVEEQVVTVSGRNFRPHAKNSRKGMENSLRTLADGATIRVPTRRSMRLDEETHADEVKVKSARALETAAGKDNKAAGTQQSEGNLAYVANLRSFLVFMVVEVHIIGVLVGVCEMQGSLSPGHPPSARPTFWTPGKWLFTWCDRFGISLFMFISAYFCSKSLDRKGFRTFVLDKLVRFGGPYLMYSCIFGPVLLIGLKEYLKYALDSMHLSAVAKAVEGKELGGFDFSDWLKLQYLFQRGPTWFVLWLLNFTLCYAVVSPFLPTLRFRMPHPLIMMTIVGPALGGIFYAIHKTLHHSQYRDFGDMDRWEYGIGEYIPFFIAGILGGRNNWLREVKEMRTWVYWTVRVVVLGFWVLIFCELAQSWKIPTVIRHLNVELLDTLTPPIFAVPMSLFVLHSWSHWFNPQTPGRLHKAFWASSYAVYVFQALFYLPLFIAYLEILKRAGVNVLGEVLNFVTTTKRADPLIEGCIWGAFFFVTITTNLLLWPSGFLVRSIPVFNKMF